MLQLNLWGLPSSCWSGGLPPLPFVVCITAGMVPKIPKKNVISSVGQIEGRAAAGC